MFLRFAVAFLEYSENLHLIRGEKKKRVPENKKHPSETIVSVLFLLFFLVSLRGD